MNTAKAVACKYPATFLAPTALMIVDILVVGIFTAKGEKTFEYFVKFSVIVATSWAIILAAGFAVLAWLEQRVRGGVR